MMNIYDSQINTPTSSNVENYIESVKRFHLNLTPKSHPLRIVDFILKHHSCLSCETKLAMSYLQSDLITEPKVSKKPVSEINTKKAEYSDSDSIFSKIQLL